MKNIIIITEKLEKKSIEKLEFLFRKKFSKI